jgi:hypothetical protein
MSSMAADNIAQCVAETFTAVRVAHNRIGNSGTTAGQFAATRPGRGVSCRTRTPRARLTAPGPAVRFGGAAVRSARRDDDGDAAPASGTRLVAATVAHCGGARA